jgi:hypothetical protein
MTKDDSREVGQEIKFDVVYGHSTSIICEPHDLIAILEWQGMVSYGGKEEWGHWALY